MSTGKRFSVHRMVDKWTECLPEKVSKYTRQWTCLPIVHRITGGMKHLKNVRFEEAGMKPMDNDRKTVKLSMETWLQMNRRDLTRYATADEYIRHLMELEKIYDNPKVSADTWEEAIIMTAKSVAALQHDLSSMNEKMNQIILMMDRNNEDGDDNADKEESSRTDDAPAEDLDDGGDVPDLTDSSVPDPYARWG